MGPAQPLMRDNDMINTIIKRLQGAEPLDFHKILLKLWYYRDYLPRKYELLGGGKTYSGPQPSM